MTCRPIFPSESYKIAGRGLPVVSLIVTWLSLALAACGGEAPAAEASPAAETAEAAAVELLPGLGSSSMPITTASERAQTYFDQGLRLLHCFWDHEAVRAFHEASRLDPSAAMPHWGVYMALTYNQHEQLDERLRALAEARRLAPAASDREQRYIRALIRLNDQGESDGQAAFIAEMEGLIGTYPDDLQAKLFLVKFLLTDTGGYFTDTREGSGGARRSASERALELLRPMLESHGDHAAVHHYFIHAQEYGPDPARALPSVEKLPSLAPGSGHILHMPGHVYYLLGRHSEAHAAFTRALEFDRDYLKRTGTAPADYWTLAHNLDYLVANCAEDGRYRAGQAWAAELAELPAPAHRHGAVGQGFILYGGRTALARLHMRYGNWPAAAASLEETLSRGALPSPAAESYLKGLLLYVRGMGAVYGGDNDAAGRSFQELLAHTGALREASAGSGGDWYFDAARRVLALATFELGGALLSAQGQHEEALDRLRQAVRMERELGYWEPPHYARPVLQTLADAHLRAGRVDAAREAYEQELELRPGSGHALFGIARTYVFENRVPEARRAMERLLEVWRHADRDLPQIRDTEAWLAANPR